MMILGITACSAGAEKHAPNSDTVALLREVVRYAADSLKVGPKIAIARITKSSPTVRMSPATQNALVASDSSLSAIERYEIARQVCDTAVKASPACHFATADGLLAVREIRLWRDSAYVAVEYYRTNAASGRKTLAFGVGDAMLNRDVNGHWRVRKFVGARQ